ncbi:hypothetical protein L1049_012443 [Liquidambar formosana]|uniref:Uncharacterized protein n=1 Tax=Liquidambar formosana TaxID=63359 RepID=A0AAP0N5K4_LIQFO
MEGNIKRIICNVNAMASGDSRKWKKPKILNLAATRSSLLPLRKSYSMGSVFKVPLECNLVGLSCDEASPKMKRACSMDCLIGPYARGFASDHQPLKLDPLDSFEVGAALESNRDSRKTTALAKAEKKKKKRLLGEILGWKKKCIRSKKVVKKKGRKLLQEPTTVSVSHLDDSSNSDGGIDNRNNLILKEARDIWNVMQQVGFRSLGNDEEILDKISDLEIRDWEVFRNK